jgi:two-component system, OmpR family, response regulator
MMASEQVPKRILIVDDEESVRLLLRDCFELEGFRVDEAATGTELTAKLPETPDLITLDLNLGGDNGLELARQVRARCNVPIVMITGKGDTIDRVVGLELGADDYITKPFHLREVLARVRAVLRRYEGSITPPSSTAGVTPGDAPPGERFAFEGWTLDIAKRELKSDTGTIVELTTAEFNMLEMFVNRPARVLSRDNIMDLLKGHDWSPLDRSIDSLLVRVRRKVEASPDKPRLIKTVRGIGYVFAADVRKL